MTDPILLKPTTLRICVDEKGSRQLIKYVRNAEICLLRSKEIIVGRREING